MPDSWGAFIVLATGRLYDWFPWALYCSIKVPLERPAKLAEALDASLYSTGQYALKRAHLCLPKSSHLKQMHAECIGQVAIDTKKIADFLPSQKRLEKEVPIGYSFSTQALQVICEDYQAAGPKLVELGL